MYPLTSSTPGSIHGHDGSLYRRVPLRSVLGSAYQVLIWVLLAVAAVEWGVHHVFYERTKVQVRTVPTRAALGGTLFHRSD